MNDIQDDRDESVRGKLLEHDPGIIDAQRLLGVADCLFHHRTVQQQGIDASHMGSGMGTVDVELRV